MSENQFRRYTKLPFLLDMLHKNRLALRNPVTWEDRNDAYFLEAYKKKRELKSLLALCFAEAPETYLHWKIYSGDESGVCIEFYKERLLAKIKNETGFHKNKVTYRTIEYLQENPPGAYELPFLKRYAYRGEEEFRFIYESREKNNGIKYITIDPEDVKIIVISPWVNKTIFDSIESTIQTIKGWEQVPMRKSTITENEDWKRIADNAV
jgi:hypothetical protein